MLEEAVKKRVEELFQEPLKAKETGFVCAYCCGPILQGEACVIDARRVTYGAILDHIHLRCYGDWRLQQKREG